MISITKNRRDAALCCPAREERRMHKDAEKTKMIEVTT
jgi:hypothetical protein